MTGPNEKRGHALVGTMAFLVMAMFLWMAAFVQVGSYARVEKACLLRQDRATGDTRALAWGLALLETGTPPQNPYSCRATPDPSTGRQFVIRFTSSGYYYITRTVTVRPAVSADQGLPVAPAHF